MHALLVDIHRRGSFLATSHRTLHIVLCDRDGGSDDGHDIKQRRIFLWNPIRERKGKSGGPPLVRIRVPLDRFEQQGRKEQDGVTGEPQAVSQSGEERMEQHQETCGREPMAILVGFHGGEQHNSRRKE